MKTITLKEAYAKATKRPLEPKFGKFDFDNGGNRPMMAGAGEDRKRIAVVDSVIKRSRKTPYDAADEERDANAALLAHAFNVLPELVEAAESIKCPAADIKDHDSLHCIRCWCYGMVASALAKANTVKIP